MPNYKEIAEDICESVFIFSKFKKEYVARQDGTE